MRLTIIISILSTALVLCAEAQVFNSNFRSINRYRPYSSTGRSPSRNPFTLTRRPGAFLRNPIRYQQRLGVRGRASTRTHQRNRLGQNAAAKGRESSIDFKDQFNAILPVRKYVKPTKAPKVERNNENKIQIETKIPSKTNSNAQLETVKAGKTAILHCTFDTTGQIGAYRQAQIWWTKLPKRSFDQPIILSAGNQVRIPDDRLRVITYPDNEFSVLVISDSITEDTGDYKCSLPTITGTKTAFTSLQVEESEAYSIATSPKVTTVEVGGELNLFCRPSDSSLKVWWTAKDNTGANIDVMHGFNKKTGPTLAMASINNKQDGIYTCHVENPTGSPMKRHFTVNVKEKPKDITAYRNGFNVDTFLNKYNKDPVYGSSVNLRCDSGGVPLPQIKWYKDGQLLNKGQKYIISSYEPTYKENTIISKMTVRDFKPSDEGSYTCRAENDSGSKTREFSLKGFYDRIYITDDDDEDSYKPSQGSRSRLVEGSGDFLLG